MSILLHRNPQFDGSLAFAESMIKDPGRQQKYGVNQWTARPSSAKFDGLEAIDIA
jgi:hypothetical protein